MWGVFCTPKFGNTHLVFAHLAYTLYTTFWIYTPSFFFFFFDFTHPNPRFMSTHSEDAYKIIHKRHEKYLRLKFKVILVNFQIDKGITESSVTVQLIWREFFYTMSVNNINFSKMKNNPICLQIQWKEDPDMLEKWKMVSLDL